MAVTGWMMMLVLLGGGGNDLLDFVSPETYWKAKGVEVTVENLLAELKPAGIADASALIKQLGASEYKAREEASRRLTAMGPAVLPELRKAAKSSDPEISARAEKIIHGFSGKTSERVVRRLMAIRTLGEQKDRRAIPTLRKLLNSKALFEAEYARAAIAAIEGKPFKRPSVPARAMQSDL
ncbi:MAG: HEAT repeat domain-containing protein, partial [Phycisphaerae bacterium]|nr:HEAT repeat domain-containing protein [Phycisphaerae bacterium]